MSMRKCRNASYTLEAALLMTLILFSLAKTVSLGIELHQEVKTAAANIEELENLNVVKIIRKLEWIRPDQEEDTILIEQKQEGN